jgi:RNA polymerase sigma factor FliA
MTSSARPVEPVDRLVSRVHAIAARMKRRLPRHIELDDLVGAGCLGLAQAIAHWRGGEPAAFEAYSLQRATGAMLDELRGHDQLTRAQRQLAGKLVATERRLANQLGRKPELEEVASAIGMSANSLHAARQKTTRYDRVSISATDGREPTTHFSAPDTVLENAQREAKLSTALGRLPDRLRTVVDLSCTEDLTLKEIGHRLGVTEARACQLRKEAVTRLRHGCRDTILPPLPPTSCVAA